MSLDLTLRQRAGWLAHVGKAMSNRAPDWLARAFAPHVPQDGVVLDIGAHAGLYARMFAKLAPRGTVFALGPSAYTLSILRTGLAWNGTKNVRIEPYGLSDAPGHFTLSSPLKRGRAEIGYGLAHLGEDRSGRECRAEQIEVRRLDDVAREQDWTRLDFVKADIEGWEGRMLAGGAETIARFKPAIYMEMQTPNLVRAGDAPQTLAQTLIAQGYNVLREEHETFVPAATWDRDGDYLFVHG